MKAFIRIERLRVWKKIDAAIGTYFYDQGGYTDLFMPYAYFAYGPLRAKAYAGAEAFADNIATSWRSSDNILIYCLVKNI